jgi:anti-sigma factor RsiW
MSDTRTSTAAPFAEELLSGYLDGALTQQEEQRVRLHLERSAEARALYAELVAMRQAGRSTPFPPAADVQWNESARSAGSALARRLGFTLLGLCVVLWVVAAVVAVAWEGAREPLAGLPGAMIAAGAGGALLVFVSVLADRLRDLPVDRYRRVLK